MNIILVGIYSEIGAVLNVKSLCRCKIHVWSVRISDIGCMRYELSLYM